MRTYPFVSAGALGALVLTASSLAWAQPTTPPPPPPAVAATPPLTAVPAQPAVVELQPDAPGTPAGGSGGEAGPGGSVGYQHGGYFFLRTPDDRYVLTLGGRLQVDVRTFPPIGGDEPPASRVLLRRVRVELAGTVLRCLHWQLSADFGSGELPTDAYLQWVPTPRLRLWAGRFNTPFGLERMWSALALPFMERSVALSTLGPGNRRVGAMADWELDDQLLHVALGLFQGSEPAQDLAGEDFDAMARIFVRPIRGDATLHLGVAGTVGRRGGQDQPNLLVGKTMFGHEWFEGVEPGAVDDAGEQRPGLVLRAAAELDFQWSFLRLTAEGYYARVEALDSRRENDRAEGLGLASTLGLTLIGAPTSRKPTRGVRHVDVATGHARLREIEGADIPWGLELDLGLDFTRLEGPAEWVSLGAVRPEATYTSARLGVHLARQQWLRFSLTYAFGHFADVAERPLTDSDDVHELGARAQVAF